MPRNSYTSGDWNVICDVCSRKIKASIAKKRWDGFIVCPDDFETRHPQDFVRAQVDKISVPFTRPRPPDAFKLVYGIFDRINIQDTFNLVSSWKRTFNDNITLSDNYHITINKNINDTLTFSDILDFIKVQHIYLNDNITFTENGIISNYNYIESDYIVDGYVGTSYIF